MDDFQAMKSPKMDSVAHFLQKTRPLWGAVTVLDRKQGNKGLTNLSQL